MTSIDDYLRACRAPSLMEEAHGVKPEAPPTADELRTLIAYLQNDGLNPVVAGSAGAFHHLALAFGNTGKKPLSSVWRPTKDVDLWVAGGKRLPTPPAGWSRDPESVGVESWRSPSGGMVDFMVGGTTFPSGNVTPHEVSVAAKSLPGIPVADIFWIIRSKLATGRMKDLSDVIDLLYAVRENPAYQQKLALFRNTLSPDEEEDLNAAQVYVDLKKTGNLTLPKTEVLHLQ